MRGAMLVAAAVLAVPAAAAAQNKAEAHPHRTFSMVRVEADWSRPADESVFAWEGDAWIGGDRRKLWLKTEGEVEGGDVHESRAELLYSHNVSTFWDVQAGVRRDFKPDGVNHLAFGVQGLAPFQFETEAFAYVSEEGDVSARLLQSLDVHLTQRMIFEPEVEIELQADDVPERRLGAGFTSAEISGQLRYEITRKFAPYVELAWRRSLGETADLARMAGEDTETTSLKAGLRVWF